MRNAISIKDSFAGLRGSPIGQHVFKRHGEGAAVVVVADITVFLHVVQSTLVHKEAVGHRLYGCEGVLDETFQKQVGQDGYGGAAHHAVGLLRHQMPHGQLALLAEDTQVGLGDAGHHLRKDDGGEGSGSAVGVPEGEGGEVFRV